jgi:hypothetical protein
VGCLVAIPLLFVLLGAWLWGSDAVRLLRWRATPAVVGISTIEQVRGSKGSVTWAPRVGYHYVVGGRSYTSTRVLPGNESRGRRWATAIADRYPAGLQTTAYVDPAAPERAFLVRRPSAGMYMFITIPLLMVLFITTERSVAARDPMPPPDPTPDGAGRWVLALDEPIAEATRRHAAAARRRRIGIIALLVPYLLVALACAGGEPGLGRKIGSLWGATLGDGFFVAQVVAFGAALWWMLRSQRAAVATGTGLHGVVVTLDRPMVRVDEPFSASAALALRDGGAPVARFLLGLQRDTMNVGGGTKSDSAAAWAAIVGGPIPSTPVFAATPSQRPPDAALESLDVDDRRIVGSATFRIPAQAPPSSVVADVKPCTRWGLVVRVAFEGAGSWDVRVPVRVHDAAPA